MPRLQHVTVSGAAALTLPLLILVWLSFYAKPIAALITAKGREILQKTVDLTQDKLGLEVIYGTSTPWPVERLKPHSYGCAR